MVIHLKRFSYSRSIKHNKLETFVNFPIHDFDLTNYVANQITSQRQLYELYALTNHYGGMGSGHYTAHIKVSRKLCTFFLKEFIIFSPSKHQLLSELVQTIVVDTDLGVVCCSLLMSINWPFSYLFSGLFYFFSDLILIYNTSFHEVQLLDENRWYNFDDHQVSPINEEEVKTPHAYVLFYRRVKTDGTSASNGAQSCAGYNHSSSQK